MMGHVYDQHFMDYTGSSSRHAANTVVRLLREVLTVDSVLDVGCATGTWLAVWRDAGVALIQGADGHYVDRQRLAIAPDCFHTADLAGTLALGRRYDLVQSLEVAEHVPETSADRFVENLVGHSEGYILFSAAPPGQGGEYHINEQPLDYWRARFARHGYRAFDYIRPRLAEDRSISFWYRYNTLLYVRDDRIASLAEAIGVSRIADSQPIPDTSPLTFRMRKWLVRSLPYGVQQGLARAKARLLSRRAD